MGRAELSAFRWQASRSDLMGVSGIWSGNAGIGLLEAALRVELFAVVTEDGNLEFELAEIAEVRVAPGSPALGFELKDEEGGGDGANGKPVFDIGLDPQARHAAVITFAVCVENIHGRGAVRFRAKQRVCLIRDAEPGVHRETDVAAQLQGEVGGFDIARAPFQMQAAHIGIGVIDFQGADQMIYRQRRARRVRFEIRFAGRVGGGEQRLQTVGHSREPQVYLRVKAHLVLPALSRVPVIPTDSHPR